MVKISSLGQDLLKNVRFFHYFARIIEIYYRLCLLNWPKLYFLSNIFGKYVVFREINRPAPKCRSVIRCINVYLTACRQCIRCQRAHWLNTRKHLSPTYPLSIYPLPACLLAKHLFSVYQMHIHQLYIEF